MFRGGWPVSGFTLIELLLVVGILTILALIAVPNMSEARTRTLLARVRADHRAMRVGLESYRVDHHAYPSCEINGTPKWVRWATTPVAYLERVHLDDPFAVGADPHDLDTLRSYRHYRIFGFNDKGYTNARTETGEIIPVYASDPGEPRVLFYALFSHGPDRIRTTDADGRVFLHSTNLFAPDRFVNFIYDPTNGTVSAGEIFTVGGEPVGRAAPSLRLVP